jgi:hypothetical protein
VQRLADRGLIEESMVGGYRKYLESVPLGIITSSGEVEATTNG